MSLRKKASLAGAAIILAACGGSGSSTAPASTSGQLTNSPIDGVGYSASPSGLSGVTANGGIYNFAQGDTVTFNIAGVQLSVPASGRVTPQTLAEAIVPASSPNVETLRQNVLLNLTTFFQTLDNDGDSENGAIEIRQGAQLGSTEALFAALDEAPGTFVGEFNTSLQGSQGVRDEGQPTPTPVNSTEALLRFYRNELQGSWKLASVVDSDGTTATATDSNQFVISFDSGVTRSDVSTNPDGPINSFVFAEYELDSEFTNVGVGTLDFNQTANEFKLTSLNRRLSSSNTEDSETASGELIIGGTTAELQGENLILTVADPAGDVVATFERFDNQKNGFTGLWYEVFADNLNDSQVSTVPPPAADGSVDFDLGAGVASIFYYVLSDDRFMIVFTDLPPGNDGDEQNGLILVNTTTANGVVTFDEVRIDSISTGAPIVEPGITIDLGESTLNDTKRSILFSGSGGSVDIYRVLSLSERVGDFEQTQQ